MSDPRLPVDPDVELSIPQQRRELAHAPWATLGAISLGGVCGALARYGLATAFPHRPGAFPWATFGTNVSGCLIIGVLMVVITEVLRPHPLLRPFLGVGVLGGFTTFSTAMVDVQQAVGNGAPGIALAYLAATLVTALAAVWTGVRLTRALTPARTRSRDAAGAAEPGAVAPGEAGARVSAVASEGDAR
ncbi:fluoride efflux transporter FluC [Actinomadura harenae]|uniref:Fluoride-specific ion channel FluC n=1 Tax=Actinomadura harenae TaxID=2483351 RepID=A0A3M2LSJ0_9ACTN|nr:CrcB family protein [Actinomadura harenae]RMI40439.1 CrcB family protein [Actinomadura harenae]